jgi:hypothetical protein
VPSVTLGKPESTYIIDPVSIAMCMVANRSGFVGAVCDTPRTISDASTRT